MHKISSTSGAFFVLLTAVLITGFTPDASSETPQATTTATDQLAVPESEQLRTVPFLTLRNKTGSDKAEEYFGGQRSIMHAGVCELERMPLNALKPIAEKAPFHIPDEIVDVAAVSELPIEALWQRLGSKSRDASPLLYVHGFYISFERGCRRALILKESLRLEGRFVLFSWPSDGAILNYTQDESDLYWSVYPLRDVLDDMISRFGAGNTNLVAHSLGTRGIMLALVLLAETRKQDHAPLFNQVVLIAPDIDVGIFRQYLPLIRPLVRNLTVYVSRNDNPLALSRQVHGYPRLGEAGTHLKGLADIDIIDLSDLPVRSPSGHVYHLRQSLMTGDLDQLINENKTAAQRNNLKKIGQNQWQLQRAGEK